MIVGIDLSTPAAGGDDPVGLAQRAEVLGFDFVSASDHPSGRGPTLETWTLLTWVLARTRRVRVATRVLSVPFRNPAVTAKMAESLSRLSGLEDAVHVMRALWGQHEPSSSLRSAHRSASSS